MRSRVVVGLLAAVALLLSGCAGGSANGGGGASQSRASADLRLRVQVVADGLQTPWDVGFLPNGSMLVTERAGKLLLITPDGRKHLVQADLSEVYAHSESGLEGIVVHPDFASDREFTTCQAHGEHGQPVDIRLVTWQLSRDGRSATRVADPLLGGLPLNPTGRHSGCRPSIGPHGALLVTTGDTARPGISQNLTRLGGKVLRLDLHTGNPWPSNPFIDNPNPRAHYVLTYGHRNPQGITVRPGTGRTFVAEHGPDRDDEINRTVPGGNYGWDPSQGAGDGYNENVPMTDLQTYPRAIRARWQSGYPTVATSGLTFLHGKQWGPLSGKLVVSCLKAQKLLVMTLGQDGRVTNVAVPEALDGTHGRLRAARQGPAGALYVTTSNGTGGQLLRITKG